MKKFYVHQIPCISNSSNIIHESTVSRFLNNVEYINEQEIRSKSKKDKVYLEFVPTYLFKDFLDNYADNFLDHPHFKKYKNILNSKNVFFIFTFPRETSPHDQYLIPLAKLLNKYPKFVNKFLYVSNYDVNEELRNLCLHYNMPVPALKNLVFEYFEVDAYDKLLVNKIQPIHTSKILDRLYLYVSINCKPEKFNRLNLALFLQEKNLLTKGNFRLSYKDTETSDNYIKDVHPLLISEFKKFNDAWNNFSEIPSIISKGTHYGYPYPVEYYNSSYVSLVAETHHGDDTRIFHTEKIYRTIANAHPFILLSVKDALRDLKQKGYRSYSPYFDETYDGIVNPYRRLESAVDNLLNEEQIKKNYALLLEIANYNKQHLIKRSKKQIKKINKVIKSL